VTVAYKKYYRNHFLNCLIRFHSLLLESNAGSNWPYQNGAKALSDSYIMKNTIETTVLQLFDILSMNIYLKMVDLNLPYQIKKKQLFSKHALNIA